VSFYGLAPAAVLALPIKTFWLMEHNINRIRADADLRQLRLSAAATNTKGIEEMSKQLAAEMGSVVIASEEREEGAAEKLRSLSARLNAS
jgi:hypothetical protein